MAYTTIDDPSKYFQTMIYTGNGAVRSLTNDGNSDLQPDWIWIKRRDSAGNHMSIDSTRGVTKVVYPHLNNAEETLSDRVTSFDSDGFSTANEDANTNTGTFVSWQWKANGGTTTAGGGTDSVSTSTHQANTTAGFSIVTYTGNDTAGATIAHGLGVVPSVIIVKDREQAKNWNIYHKGINGTPENFTIRLNSTAARVDTVANAWNGTAPTSSVFSIGDGSQVNSDGITYVAYCFAEKQGYSKFGKYTGNANAEGPFVYTGFKVSWVMIKNIDATANWHMYDNKRDAENVVETAFQANSSDAEFTTSNKLDFVSNGFKIRAGNQVSTNHDGVNYIYMAFAESPFVSSKGVPTTAR